MAPELRAPQVAPQEIPAELGLLRPAPFRWRSFTGGFAVQAILFAFMAHFLFYEASDNQPEPQYEATELYAPPAPFEAAPPPLRLTLQHPPVERSEEPIRRPKIPGPVQPIPKVQMAQALPQTTPDLVLPKTQAAIPRLKMQPRTNVFPGPTAAATLKLPAAKVQTGGFGDPNGVPANPKAHGAVEIAQVGSFDLPDGPGAGNGTGGAHGARGTIASAGFGNVISKRTESGMPGGSIQRAGFGEVVTATHSTPKPDTSVKLALVPAEIVSKPQPSYTAEARQKRIEGEVLLDVIFGADGHLRVLRVAQGLGHGLDESAIHAAENIVFKPARRDGQPVDSTARIHITFQLA
jgi:TonB family protein